MIVPMGIVYVVGTYQSRVRYWSRTGKPELPAASRMSTVPLTTAAGAAKVSPKNASMVRTKVWKNIMVKFEGIDLEG
jgi:hypothetical protein